MVTLESIIIAATGGLCLRKTTRLGPSLSYQHSEQSQGLLIEIYMSTWLGYGRLDSESESPLRLGEMVVRYPYGRSSTKYMMQLGSIEKNSGKASAAECHIQIKSSP